MLLPQVQMKKFTLE